MKSLGLLVRKPLTSLCLKLMDKSELQFRKLPVVGLMQASCKECCMIHATLSAKLMSRLLHDS
ncbi:CLUMA_CG019918, isoform A [Clunio marinus]|uniref:CLUMA_CG019918, isoform A n=1 Tax=Clunio marinus TaxID=568069 RepID=A0A1J1J6E5_9DIPT|nr:CLUMA_CG019918, isoform A [Clunio marinus]